MTAVPGAQVSDLYFKAFIFSASQATAEEASLAEKLDSGAVCRRQMKGLLEILFLDIDNPRGLVSDTASSAIQKSKAEFLFQKINANYSLLYPSMVRHESANDFYLIEADKTSPLTDPDQVQIDLFATALAALNNETIDSSGTRNETEVACSEKRAHAANLVNLQFRFPGVLGGQYKSLSGFEQDIENIELLLTELRKI
jgi:hypothetical protein